MNLLQNNLLEIISALSMRSYVNNETVVRFKNRLLKSSKLTRDENVKAHFCAFFIPFDPSQNKVFFVHHKKAQDWIPPGGHIDEDELPLATVMREYKEELGNKIKPDKISLYNISYKKIENSPTCEEHFDLWYVVKTPVKVFKIDTEEFYDARWINKDKVQEIMKTQAFLEVFKSFPGVF